MKVEKAMINTREIEDIEVDGIDTRDYPDFADAYIRSAVWCETGEELTDDEMELLNTDYEFIHEEVQKYLY